MGCGAYGNAFGNGILDAQQTAEEPAGNVAYESGKYYGRYGYSHVSVKLRRETDADGCGD